MRPPAGRADRGGDDRPCTDRSPHATPRSVRILFLSGINERKASHHSRDSGFRRRALLSKFLAKNEQTDPFCFLCSRTEVHVDALFELGLESGTNSSSRDFESSGGFFFFSNQVDLANQFEAVLELLADEKDLSMGRIILFLNSTFSVANPQLTAWIDAAGHFSDAICFTQRKNENAMAISQCKERFKP